MFIPSNLKACLFGLVGFRNHYNADVPALDADLLITRSTQIFQDENHLVDLDVIQNTIPEGRDISEYLREKVNQAIYDINTKVFTNKKLKKITKTLFSEIRVFKGVGRLQNTIIKKGRFVGIELQVSRYTNIKSLIKQIGFQFTEPQPNLTIHLFHSSQEEPVDTQIITTTKTNGFEWVDSDFFLEYDSDTHDVGGAYYLGYFEDDVIGQAVNKIDFDFGKGCCTCDRQGHNDWNLLTTYVKMAPFSVDAGSLNGTNLWDIDNNDFDLNNNFGLNFKISTICDLSAFLCSQDELFIDVMSKQVAVNILQDMSMSFRLNQRQGVTQSLIIRELDGIEDQADSGLKTRLDNAIEALEFDFSNLDSPCLPCEETRGVRRATM